MPHPSRLRRLRIEPLEDRRVLSALPLGATPQDTAEFMLGRVAVTPVLLESDGRIDPNLENWTQSEIAGVLQNLRDGLQWWVDTLAEVAPGHDLEFVIDDRFAVDPHPTPYEPIHRSSDHFHLYVGQFLVDVGYGSQASLKDAILAFNHDQRLALETDWAFTVFVVDASGAPNNQFPSGSFSQAFAFAGGLFFITPSTRPASTYAHETGHIFWARDEYQGGGSWTDQRGYYDTQNWNAWDNPTPGFVHQPSIMSAGTTLAQAYHQQISPPSTLAQVGWQDSSGNGIIDLLDVPLDLDATAVYRADLGELHLQGTASAVPLINRNSSGNQSDITLNRVRLIEYRVDGGPWQTAATPDVPTASLDLALPLGPGFSQVEVRARDDRSGVVSPSLIITPERPAMTAAAMQGFAWVDANGDGQWDSDESLLAGLQLQLVPPEHVLVGRVEPDELPSGAITGSLPGVTLSAQGVVLDGRVGALSGTASTGSKNFQAYNLQANDWVETWTSARDRRLVATFDSPVTQVEIDAIAPIAGAYGRLEAYDADGKLLIRTTVGPLAAGEAATMRVEDPQGRIASIRAFGHADTNVALDHLRFGPDLVAVTDSFGVLQLPNLPDGVYQLNWSSPSWVYELQTPLTELEVLDGEAPLLAVAATRIPSPWTNPANTFDVDGNGHVTPLDALLIINELNRNGSRTLDEPDLHLPFVDTNGDGRISPLDALLLINHLNRGAPAAGEGAGEEGLAPTGSESLAAAEAQPSSGAAGSLEPLEAELEAESGEAPRAAPWGFNLWEWADLGCGCGCCAHGPHEGALWQGTDAEGEAVSEIAAAFSNAPSLSEGAFRPGGGGGPSPSLPRGATLGSAASVDQLFADLTSEGLEFFLEPLPDLGL